jgi:hypothetical protein
MSLASTTACAAVIGFFLSSVVIVPTLLRRSALPASERNLFITVIIFSVSTKMVLATVGTRVDIEAYRTFANLVEQGKSLYASIGYYAYAPVWAWIVSGLDRLALLLHCEAGQGFHVLVAALLAVTDVLIAIVLLSEYSFVAAILFLLSPVGFAISGFLSQFDNLALLVALMAWMIIREGRPKPTMLVISAFLAGFSLTIKHDIFLFPLWLVFWKPLGNLPRRILYAAIAYSLFFGSFLPWWKDPISRAGIIQNVFGYNSEYGRSLFGRTTELFVSISSIDSFFRWVPAFSGFKLMWIGLMVLIGIAIARRCVHELFLYYLLALYAFAPSIYVQYMLVAMIACAVFYRAWPSWAFLMCATGALLVDAFIALAVDGHFVIRPIQDFTLWGHSYDWKIVVGLIWVNPMIFASQLCVIALLVLLWRAEGKFEKLLPARVKLFRAATLTACGSLPWMILTVTKKVWAVYVLHGRLVP